MTLISTFWTCVMHHLVMAIHVVRRTTPMWCGGGVDVPKNIHTTSQIINIYFWYTEDPTNDARCCAHALCIVRSWPLIRRDGVVRWGLVEAFLFQTTFTQHIKLSTDSQSTPMTQRMALDVVDMRSASLLHGDECRAKESCGAVGAMPRVGVVAIPSDIYTTS